MHESAGSRAELVDALTLRQRLELLLPQLCAPDRDRFHSGLEPVGAHEGQSERNNGRKRGDRGKRDHQEVSFDQQVEIWIHRFAQYLISIIFFITMMPNAIHTPQPNS